MGEDLVLAVKYGQSLSRAEAYRADRFEKVGDVWSGVNVGHKAKDGVKYSNAMANMGALISALEGYPRVGDLTVIDGTIWGAVADLVGEDEMPIRPHGVQSNVHEPSSIACRMLDAHMPPDKRFREYMLPGLGGCLEPARTIVGWAVDNRELLRRAKRIRFLDQLAIAPLVERYQGMEGEPGVSASYLGCHTGLKNMRGSEEELLEFSELAKMLDNLVMAATGRKLIGDLIPNRIYTPRDNVHFRLDSTIASYTGLRRETRVNPFTHDTTGEEVAVTAIARKHFPPTQSFIDAVWGTWYMDRVVPGQGEALTPIDPELCGRGIMGQTDLYGRPVKTVLTASGMEFKMLREELKRRGLNPPEVDEEYIARVGDVVREAELFAIQGRSDQAKFASQFPGSVARFVGPEDEMFRDPETAYAVANLMAIAPKVRVRDLLRVGDDVPYIITGGSAGRGGAAEMFASAVPNPVYRIVDRDGHVVEEIGALSTWMSAVASLRGELPEDVDISSIGYSLREVPKSYSMAEMRRYVDAWCALAEARV